MLSVPIQMSMNVTDTSLQRMSLQLKVSSHKRCFATEVSHLIKVLAISITSGAKALKDTFFNKQ